MKAAETNLNKLKYLSSVCEDTTPFKTRFAVISTNKAKYPHILDIILLFIEYAQLVSQSIIINYNSFPNQEISGISRVVLKFAQTLTPGCLFTLRREGVFNTEILIILMLWIVAKYLLFIYIVLICKKSNFQKSSVLITVWKWLVKIQSRVLYYFITSFWFTALIAVVDNNSHFDFKDSAVVGIACFAIILDFIFSFINGIGFSYILPSSHFLCSKSMKGETVTLFQKFVVQVFEISPFFRTTHP